MPSDLRDTPNPVIAAKNKYNQVAAQCDEDCDKPKEAVTKARLMERIALSEKERVEGVSKDAFESAAAMRAHYKL